MIKLMMKKEIICFSGLVVHGHKRWREIGFPTINIILDDEALLCSDAVYVFETCYKGREYFWVWTIMKKTWLFEGHVFDFDEDVYGCTFRICLLVKIRKNRSFDSFSELREQIERDVNFAKNYLHSVGL